MWDFGAGADTNVREQENSDIQNIADIMYKLYLVMKNIYADTDTSAIGQYSLITSANLYIGLALVYSSQVYWHEVGMQCFNIQTWRT